MNTDIFTEKALELAVRGRLTNKSNGGVQCCSNAPQKEKTDEAEEYEPASAIVERIRDERQRMLTEGTLRMKNIKVNTGIYKGEDGLYYEKAQGSVNCIQEEIPYDLPEDWEWCRLGSLFRTVTGNTPPTGDAELYGGEYPFYKPSDLDKGFAVDSAAETVTERGFERGHTAPLNSVLVTCIGTVGKTGYIRKQGIFNQQMNAILPNRMISPEYTYFSMCADYMQKQIRANSSSATMPILNKTKFDNLLFILPPLNTQKKIAEKLKRIVFVSEKIRGEREELELLISRTKEKVLDMAVRGKLVPQEDGDEPAEALLKRIGKERGSDKRDMEVGCDNSYYEKLKEKAFEIPRSWKFTSLRRIGRIVGGGTPKTSVSEYWNGDIPWVTPSDLGGKEKTAVNVIAKGERSISRKGLDSSTARIVPEGAVLYSCRAPIGYAAIAENPLATSQGIKAFIPYSEISSEYIYFCLKAFTENIVKNASGASFKEISAAELGATVLPLPPKKEQERISSKIKEIFTALDKILKCLE